MHYIDLIQGLSHLLPVDQLQSLLASDLKCLRLLLCGRVRVVDGHVTD